LLGAARRCGLMTQGFVSGYLGYLLGQANHALYKDFDADVRAAGLQSLEWRILATLSDSPAMPISQLAHEVLAKQPTVTKAVQRMLAQGWLGLQADASDQRRTLASITATGQAVVAPLLTKAQAHEAQVLKALGSTDVAALKALLAKLARMT
jgi:DNA-binding MarR family transcriptional regulator